MRLHRNRDIRGRRTVPGGTGHRIRPYCWSQWNAAHTRPPHLKTIVAYDGATDMYRDWMYQGGIPTQGFLASWLLGSVLYQHALNGIDYRAGAKSEVLHDALSHPFDDEWQRRRSPFWQLPKVDIPVLSIGVWGKGPLHLRGNFYGYERVAGPKQLLIAHPDSFHRAQMYFFDEDFHRPPVRSTSTAKEPIVTRRRGPHRTPPPPRSICLVYTAARLPRLTTAR
jgi:hypothetical protein